MNLLYLAKINDSFMSGKNRKGSHWWIIDKDEKGKVYAVLTTHLFVPDNIRFKQIKDGQLIQVKFSCFDNPSGVYKDRIYKSHNGVRLSYRSISENSVDKRRFKIQRKEGVKVD